MVGGQVGRGRGAGQTGRGQIRRQILEELLLFGLASEAEVGDLALAAEQQLRQVAVELGALLQVVLHLHVDVVRRGQLLQQLLARRRGPAVGLGLRELFVHLLHSHNEISVSQVSFAISDLRFSSIRSTGASIPFD